MKIESTMESTNVLIFLRQGNGNLIEMLDVDFKGTHFDTKEELKTYIMEAMEEREWELSRISNFNEELEEIALFYKCQLVANGSTVNKQATLNWIHDRLAHIAQNCDIKDKDVLHTVEVLNYIKNHLY